MTYQTNNGTITIHRIGRSYEGVYADGTLVYSRTSLFASKAAVIAAANASARSALHAAALRA